MEDDKEQLISADCHGQEERENEDEPQRDGCCDNADSGCCHSNNHHQLSVQSGDIVRPPALSHGRVYQKLFPIVDKIVSKLLFHPLISLVILIIVIVVALILASLMLGRVFPIAINISIESFQVPDHDSSIHWDAYQAVLNQHIYNGSDSTDSSASSKDLLNNAVYRGGGGGGEEKSVTSSGGRFCCSEGPDYHQRTMHGVWVLELVYLGRNGKNLLETDRIEHIHSIEEHIYNLEKYKSVCHFQYGEVCDPINSLLTYLYPRSKEDGSLESETLAKDWKSSVDISHLSAEEVQHLLWYTGGQIGKNLTTSLLRAQVRVGVPLPCYCSYSDRTEEQHKKVTKFFISLIPFLDQASNSDIEVLYGGSEIFDYELNSAKIHDITLGAVSLSLVLLIMFPFTGFSLSLTLWGGMSILTCLVISLFVYRVFLGYETFSLLTIVTIFVIIGIGVDDVFVFLNTFKQSRWLNGLDSTHKRLTHTILVATTATFCTSATTTIAFLANAVSQIPAVRQFAIFTGLVIFFCFITVATTMPLFLHIWQSWFRVWEEYCFLPFLRCCKSRCSRSYTPVDSIRMSKLTSQEADTDSGISEDKSSDSTGSDSNSVGSDSHSSTSSLDDMGIETQQQGETAARTALTGISELENGNQTQTQSGTRVSNSSSVETQITLFLQKALLLTVARAFLYPQLVHYNSISNRWLRGALRWATRLLPVALFVVILVAMTGAMSQLQPTDHTPQFFDPDSNIQRMLDLEGNLTQREVVNGWNFSAWYPKDGTGGSSTGGDGGGTSATDKPSSSTSSPSTTTTSSPTSQTSPTSSSTPTTAHTQPTTPSTKPTTQQTDPTHPSSSETPPTSSSSGSTQTDTPTTPTVAPPPQTQASDLLNNVMVYVVFGVKGVKRKYSTSHVLPVEGEGRQAILDPLFSSTLTCPPSTSSLPLLITTLRAMCQICRNISNPDNGLVLEDTYTCFPPALLSRFSQCLPGYSLDDFDECDGVLGGNDHVDAHFNYTTGSDGGLSLTYLAMAFKSTTSLSKPATESVVDYEKWEDFLSSELSAIKHLSTSGQEYSGAWDVLQYTFQASDYWVQINTEIIAIRGSFYGILISIILCAVVVSVLSNNWSVVSAMGLTILGILVTLLGLFKLFGWTLGIIEAVSLSILVGNSLDYCIHLSEGYVATDQRHLDFLSKFKFTEKAPLRVKRVLSSISFIGVSILSSALTTLLATLPLLGAKILLFTRFAQILLLDTAVAILYTLFFCGTFLSLFGPLGKSRSVVRVLNAVLTVFGTAVLMVVVFFVSTHIMTMYNVI